MIEGFSNNRLICLHFHQYHLRRFLGKSAVVHGSTRSSGNDHRHYVRKCTPFLLAVLRL